LKGFYFESLYNPNFVAILENTSGKLGNRNVSQQDRGTGMYLQNQKGSTLKEVMLIKVTDNYPFTG
jgi:hypothetical protein